MFVISCALRCWISSALRRWLRSWGAIVVVSTSMTAINSALRVWICSWGA